MVIFNGNLLACQLASWWWYFQAPPWLIFGDQKIQRTGRPVNDRWKLGVALPVKHWDSLVESCWIYSTSTQQKPCWCLMLLHVQRWLPTDWFRLFQADSTNAVQPYSLHAHYIHYQPIMPKITFIAFLTISSYNLAKIIRIILGLSHTSSHVLPPELLKIEPGRDRVTATLRVWDKRRYSLCSVRLAKGLFVTCSWVNKVL